MFHSLDFRTLAKLMPNKYVGMFISILVVFVFEDYAVRMLECIELMDRFLFLSRPVNVICE